MNIVLLSGGSGKRLWPLSNDVRSKQFIKMFRQGGEYESMLQRMYRQAGQVFDRKCITVATAKSQVSAIINQLGHNVDICAEPCRRDTFPAIALVCAYLADIKKTDKNDTVVVCPVDPYVDEEYFQALARLAQTAALEDSGLVLMGIKPTYPSEKYGYIIPAGDGEICAVDSFKEKPDISAAEKFIGRGALWNSGVFAFKLKYLLDKAHTLIDFTDYDDLFSKYEQLPKVSFDYAVAEKEKNIRLMRFDGRWMDLGTWNTLTEVMEEKIIGDAVLNETCENVNVLNELDVPILCMGLRNAVVSASPEGILVSDKQQSSYIKPFVEKFDNRVMFAEKSWGSFKIIDAEKGSLTVKVTLNAGSSMNYHSHAFRDEIWTVISGRGKVTVDGMEYDVKTGDVVTMERGCKHTVFAETELRMIEVQIGREISVNDKEKFPL